MGRIIIAFLFVVAFVLVFSYFVLGKAHNNWSVIPKPLRWIVIPVYSLVTTYIVGAVFEWVYWVPNAIQFVLNLVFGFINIKWLYVAWTIVKALLALPYFLNCFAVLVLLPTYEKESLYTFNTRRVVLLIVTLILLYAFIFDPMSGIEWYENAIFVVAIIVTSIFTYSVILHENNKGNEKRKMTDVIKTTFKLFFSKANPIVIKTKSLTRVFNKTRNG